MRQVRTHGPRVVLLASGDAIGETTRAIIDGFTCFEVSLFPEGAQQGLLECLGKANAVVVAGRFNRDFVQSLTARCRASDLPVFNCGSRTGRALLAILTKCIEAVGHSASFAYGAEPRARRRTISMSGSSPAWSANARTGA